VQTIVLELRAVTDAHSSKPRAAWIDVSGDSSTVMRRANLFVDGSPLNPPIVSFGKTSRGAVRLPGRVVDREAG
jgi:hypothetical protein